MRVRQQIGNRQVVGAAGQAVTAAVTGGSVVRFPPVAGAADQVVALLGEGLHAVAHGQVAQPQQLGNRHGVGAGQAGAALAAEIAAELLSGLLL